MSFVELPCPIFEVVCDDCGTVGPPRYSKDECYSAAKDLGWRVGVWDFKDDEYDDMCASCAKEREVNE